MRYLPSFLASYRGEVLLCVHFSTKSVLYQGQSRPIFSNESAVMAPGSLCLMPKMIPTGLLFSLARNPFASWDIRAASPLCRSNEGARMRLLKLARPIGVHIAKLTAFKPRNILGKTSRPVL